MSPLLALCRIFYNLLHLNPLILAQPRVYELKPAITKFQDWKAEDGPEDPKGEDPEVQDGSIHYFSQYRGQNPGPKLHTLGPE
jgi:hypothetical protein